MKILKIVLFTLVLCASISGFAQNALTQTTKPYSVTPSKVVSESPTTKLRYYYFPNLEAYFDIHKNIYYYVKDGKWTTAKEIPNGYRGYGMFNKCKVGITDYDGDDPTQFLKAHKKQYPYAANGKIKNMMASSE